MTRLLELLVSELLTRPARVLVCALAVPFLLAIPVANTQIDLSFASVFPEDDPVIGPYMEMSERLRLSQRLQVLLEGEPEVLEQGARAARDALLAMPDVVDDVVVELPTEWIEANLPWVVPDATFEDLLAAVQGDEGAAGRLDETAADIEVGLSADGARLVLLDLSKDPLAVSVEDVTSGRSPYARVERALAEVLDPLDLTWGITGVSAIAGQDQAQTLRTVSLLSPLSLMAVLVLLLLVEPRPTRLALVAVPMVLAVVGTLGVVSLVFGKLTFNEAFFGMFIFGLGVDYALHLIVRLREEQADGAPFPEALAKTVRGAGRAIVAGAVTTVGAFVAVGLAPDPQPRHMGVTGAAGLLLCLFLMLTLLPATWMLLQRRGPPRSRRVLAVPLLGNIAAGSVRRPGLVVLLTVALLGAAIAGIPRFRAETDLTKIFNRDVPAVPISARVQELFDLGFSPWVVVSPTLEEARRVHRAFDADEAYRRVDGAGALFPGALDERAARLEEVAPRLAERRLMLDALQLGLASGLPAPPGLDVDSLPRVREILERLEKAARAGPPDLDGLPPAVRRAVRTDDGAWLTFAHSDIEGLDAVEYRAARLHAQSIDSGAVGFGNFVESGVLGPTKWAGRSLLWILFFVALVLAVDLRSPRWTVLALAPVVCAAVMTFGALCWLDVGFTILPIFSVPLLIGLGVDDGLHVVHRMREDASLAPAVAAESVGRAIAMTTLTTCSSFAVLLFANHPGMESMALVMLIGLPLCLLGSVSLIPALAVLLRLRPHAGAN